MPFLISDRIKETTTTTGTGTLTLAGAVTGFRAFSTIGNTNTTSYCIIAVDANGVPTGEWETGIGTYTLSGTTLSRGFIASSTGSLLSFAAGTKHVICTDVANYTTPLVMATTANRAIQVADQTALSATSGNARGVGAVDLQTKRNSAAKVASGNYSTISGGISNTGSGANSSVGGGNNNVASGASATVGGGYGNTAANTYTTIGGGRSNVANNIETTVAGGRGNTASGARATVGGGYGNIASGSRSVIGGGYGNLASSYYAVVSGGRGNSATTNTHPTVCGGYLNTASGGKSFVGGGRGNTASALYSCVPGGFGHTASGTASTCFGHSGKADKYGQVVFSSGAFATAGDRQTSHFMLNATTTNNTQTEMFLTNGSGQMTLSNDTTWAFQVLLTARRTDVDGTNSTWKAEGGIKRDTNAASTALIGTCTPSVIVQDAGAAACAVDVTADTATGALRIRITGETSKSYKWHAVVFTSEVTG